MRATRCSPGKTPVGVFGWRYVFVIHRKAGYIDTHCAALGQVANMADTCHNFPIAAQLGLDLLILFGLSTIISFISYPSENGCLTALAALAYKWPFVARVRFVCISRP